MHMPKYTEYSGSETLVVFIHGFMGSPSQFDDLAEAAFQKGCSVLTVLLPGHGGSAKNFVSTELSAWETHLQDEINKYKDNYLKIYLAGHSMGGLLALNASIYKDNKISGVFMLSSPMKINYINPKSLSSKIKLLAFDSDPEIKRHYLLSCSVNVASLYCLFLIRPVLQLQKLIGKTKNHLSDVCVPVTLIHSTNDETVSFKSAKILYDGLSNTCRKAIPIHQSWHAYYTADERKKICGELLSLID